MVFPYMFIPNVYPKMVKNIVNNPDLSLNPEKLRIDLCDWLYLGKSRYIQAIYTKIFISAQTLYYHYIEFPILKFEVLFEVLFANKIPFKTLPNIIMQLYGIKAVYQWHFPG